jgi:hypothetical protein
MASRDHLFSRGHPEWLTHFTGEPGFDISLNEKIAAKYAVS